MLIITSKTHKATVLNGCSRYGPPSHSLNLHRINLNVIFGHHMPQAIPLNRAKDHIWEPSIQPHLLEPHKHILICLT